MKSLRSTLSRYLLSALVVSLCNVGPSMTATGQRGTVTRGGRNAGVTELRNLDQLREAFQRDSGKVRLIALLSPT